MTTIADLIRDTRARLSGTFTDELNMLANAYNPGDQTISLSYDASIGVGSVISCEENTWYVVAADAGASKTFRVIPSYDGGPDLAKPTGSLVRVKPRVTDWGLFVLIRDQINLMSSPGSGLGRFDFWMDVGLSDTGQYPPPDGVTPARLRAVYGSDGTRWWPVSGAVLQMGTVRVWDDRWAQYCFVYQEPFAEVTGFAQDAESDIGLSRAMLDIPPLGAAGMTLLTMESRRGQLGAQGDPRRSQEVQAGSNIGAGREMLRMRDKRIAEEYERGLNLASMSSMTGITV